MDDDYYEIDAADAPMLEEKVIKYLVGWKKPNLLNGIPRNLRTAKVCLAAVKANIRAMEWVPQEIQTVQFCHDLIALGGWYLQCVPQNMRTSEMCLAAVTQNRGAILFVPEDLKTEELFLAAVTCDGLALEYVPEKLRTWQMCQCAIRSNFPRLIVLSQICNCDILDSCAVLEIDDIGILDSWMGSERRKKAMKRLDEELTKGIC